MPIPWWMKIVGRLFGGKKRWEEGKRYSGFAILEPK
jgi:hypothetical protein